MRQNIEAVNAAMAPSFPDLTKADVYESADGSFCYVAASPEPDGRPEDANGCAPFMDPGYVRPVDPTTPLPPDNMNEVLSRRTITMLEGPSLLTLGGVAEALAGSESPEYARDVLQPRVGIQRSVGSFESGFFCRPGS